MFACIITLYQSLKSLEIVFIYDIRNNQHASIFLFIFIIKNTTACFAVKTSQVFLILFLNKNLLNRKYLRSLNGETGCSISANKDISICSNCFCY